MGVGANKQEMIQPNEPIATICSEQLGQTIYSGLDVRTHMAIEFAKAICTNPHSYELMNIEKIAGFGIDLADELIKQLNSEQ